MVGWAYTMCPQICETFSLGCCKVTLDSFSFLSLLSYTSLPILSAILFKQTCFLFHGSDEGSSTCNVKSISLSKDAASSTNYFQHFTFIEDYPHLQFKIKSFMFHAYWEGVYSWPDKLNRYWRLTQWLVFEHGTTSVKIKSIFFCFLIFNLRLSFSFNIVETWDKSLSFCDYLIRLSRSYTKLCINWYFMN